MYSSNFYRVGGVYPIMLPEQGGASAPEPEVEAVLGRGGDAARHPHEDGDGLVQLPGECASQWPDQREDLVTEWIRQMTNHEIFWRHKKESLFAVIS